jgi:hypothetical protein
MALAIKKTVSTPVNSSIIDVALYFDILSEVKTTKQKPIRLEDVFKICSDFIIGHNFSLCLNFNYD